MERIGNAVGMTGMCGFVGGALWLRVGALTIKDFAVTFLIIFAGLGIAAVGFGLSRRSRSVTPVDTSNNSPARRSE